MTLSQEGEPPDSLSIGRVIRAPITVVFDAWLDTRLMAQWMKPRPEVSTEVRLDSTVGGSLQVIMRAHGRQEVHEGAFRLIDRPNRLSFTWSSAPAGPNTVVDVSFVASEGGRTMLLLKHDGLASQRAVENHREGWQRILDALTELLDARA